MNKIVNSIPYRAKNVKHEFLNNLPAIAANFSAKNAIALEEDSLKAVLDRASKDMRDGLVTFRSIRQFRKEAAYKLQPGLDGVLPWRAEAASVSCAFAIIAFMYSNYNGVRMIERLEKKTKFAGVGSAKTAYISPLAPFPNVPNGLLSTIRTLIDEILDSVPGDGYLISDDFYNQCKHLVKLITSSFGKLAPNTSATAESIALYKVARVCDVLSNLVSLTAGTYQSLKNVLAQVVEVGKYIDHSNWSSELMNIWKSFAAMRATEILRKGVEILDSDVVNDVYKVGRFVVETNTLKPDAYLKIFESESVAVMEAIDEYNKYQRHMLRIGEVQEFLNLSVVADALDLKPLTDAYKRLSNVVLFSVAKDGSCSKGFTGSTGMTNTEILDTLSKQESRLKLTLESLTQTLDAYFQPSMYEPWSGCAITWTDANRAKIIRSIRRRKTMPTSAMIHKLNKVETKIAGIESHASEGLTIGQEYGLFLNNDAMAEGATHQKDGDGTVFMGEWDDLIEHALRMSGVFELAVNKDNNAVTPDTSYLIGYTVRVPKEGEDYMTTGPINRRDRDGREFRIGSLNMTQNMPMSSDLLFFFRHGDIDSSSVRGLYLNRIEALTKPYIATEMRIARCTYYSESDIISPLIMKESAGAHILHEYVDCVYLPSAFKPLYGTSSQEIDMQSLKDYIIPPGRALTLKFTDTFTFDPYFLTQYALQSLNASPTKQLTSRSYRGSDLAILDGNKQALTVTVFSDDSGMLAFTRGDSFKDPDSDSRLVYISYSDPNLNGTVSSRNCIIESNGVLATSSCFLISPVMKTELRNVIAQGPIYYMANIIRNCAYAAATRFFFKRDQFMGVKVFDEAVNINILSYVTSLMKEDIGSNHRAASVGFETSFLMRDIYDAIDAYINDPKEETSAELLKKIDPVLGELNRKDAIIHPCIPITSSTDNTGKIDKFLNGDVLYDATAISGVNIPSIDVWFKKNYGAYVAGSIKATLDMTICFG